MTIKEKCALRLRRTHLLVVEPVPTDSPPVVAEVILYGRVCHLVAEK